MSDATFAEVPPVDSPSATRAARRAELRVAAASGGAARDSLAMTFSHERRGKRKARATLRSFLIEETTTYLDHPKGPRSDCTK